MSRIRDATHHALAFRNQHPCLQNHAPFVHAKCLPSASLPWAQDQGHQQPLDIHVRTPIHHARWPVRWEESSPTNGHKINSTELKTYTITSVDNFVSLHLHAPHCLTYTVSFPVQVALGNAQEFPVEDVPKEQAPLHYTFLTQCGVVANAPSWLNHPLSLLLHALRPHIDWPKAGGHALPVPGFLREYSQFCPSSAGYITSPLPLSNQHTRMSNTANALFSPALHLPILCMWQADLDLLFRLVLFPLRPEQDDSCPFFHPTPTTLLLVYCQAPDRQLFVYDGEYLSSVEVGDAAGLTFRSDVVPKQGCHPRTGITYHLRPMVEGCLMLYVRAVQSLSLVEGALRCGNSASPSRVSPTTRHVAASSVLEHLDIPDVGQFTAYADGRVCAVFEDRTVLKIWTLSPAHPTPRDQVDILDAAGQSHTLRMARPIEFEAYVHHALQFARWAHASPAERHQATIEQEQARAHVRQVQRRSRGFVGLPGKDGVCLAAVKARNTRFLQDAG
jgi:hypothetical protein